LQRTTAAASVLLGAARRGWPQARSRVVVLFHQDASSTDPQSHASAMTRLVHGAVQRALGAPNPQAAWRRLLGPGDRVGIKLSCLTPALSPNRDLVAAIVEGVKSAGVPPQNIVLFDKENRDLLAAGYGIVYDGPEPRCYGTVGGAGSPGYEERFTTLKGTTVRLSKILTRQCTALINVPVLKDHEHAGITAALKNHFGCIHNPEDFHAQKCDPAVADLNTAPDIRTKQRLVIADATRVLCDGGPSFKADAVWEYNAVFCSTDPVALDAEAAALLDAMREQMNLPSLADAGRPPRHVQTAAGYGLGVADLNSIDLLQEDLA